MATLVARSRVNPGTPVEARAIPVGGLTEFRVRLSPNLADFDDPTLRCTCTVALSFDDGKSYPHETIAEIVGGARGKDGLPPSVGVAAFGGDGREAVFPAGTRAKVTYVHTKRCRMGLESETR